MSDEKDKARAYLGRDGKPRIEIVFGNVAYVLTLDEWARTSMAVRAALDTLRAKCPTCRCRIMPGAKCMCCESAKVDREIDGLLGPNEGKP